MGTNFGTDSNVMATSNFANSNMPNAMMVGKQEQPQQHRFNGDPTINPDTPVMMPTGTNATANLAGPSLSNHVPRAKIGLGAPSSLFFA